MPVRFLSPSLGGYSGFVAARHWEVGAAFRRLGADQWFVGSEVRESAAPFGQPLFLNIYSLDATITYGVTDRLVGSGRGQVGPRIPARTLPYRQQCCQMGAGAA